jgi:hypothetical protein
MHPTLQGKLVEHRQAELLGASRRRRAPRRGTPAKLVHAPARAVGLVLVHVGLRLVGPEELGAHRTTLS